MTADKRKQECFPQIGKMNTCVLPCSQAQVLNPSEAASAQGWQRLLWIARAEEPVNGGQSTTIHPGRGVWEPSPLHALLGAAAADRAGTVRPASGPSPAGAAAAQAAFCLAAIYSQLQMLTKQRATDRRTEGQQCCGADTAGSILQESASDFPTQPSDSFGNHLGG